MSEPTERPPVSAPQATEASAHRETSLVRTAAVLLRGRRTIVGLAMAFAILAFVRGFTSRDFYTTTVQFLAQSGASSRVSRLATSLAGRLGIGLLAGVSAGQSPDFYRELLRSRAVLAPVVLRKYSVHARGGRNDSVPLLDLMKVRGPTPAVRLARGIKRLRELTRPSVDELTGVVTVTVSTHWPEVSYQVASAVLQQVEDFNQRTRRTQAKAERDFLAGRVSQARARLHAAEDSLQAFLQQNRQFNNSPELTFQHDRLERRVSMRQDLYTNLSEAYEQARVEAVRNTPVITVVERPIVPPIRRPHGTKLLTLLGGILGGMLGAGIVIMKASVGGEPDPDTLALREAWADTKRGLRLGRRRRHEPSRSAE